MLFAPLSQAKRTNVHTAESAQHFLTFPPFCVGKTGGKLHIIPQAGRCVGKREAPTHITISLLMLMSPEAARSQHGSTPRAPRNSSWRGQLKKHKLLRLQTSRSGLHQCRPPPTRPGPEHEFNHANSGSNQARVATAICPAGDLSVKLPLSRMYLSSYPCQTIYLSSYVSVGLSTCQAICQAIPVGLSICQAVHLSS